MQTIAKQQSRDRLSDCQYHPYILSRRNSSASVNPNLRIPLGSNQSNPLAQMITQTIAEQLSTQFGQPVTLNDLNGLTLVVWTEDNIETDSELVQFLQSDRPIQGLLLQERSSSSRSCVAVAMAGTRLEFAGVG